MGNDGGSIPKRRELVKEAARLPSASERKATVLESQSHAWTTCPLSSEPLDPCSASTSTTIVSDSRGRLYSYEAVLQCLTTTSSSSSPTIPEAQATEFARTGIRGLRDVAKLRFATRRDERGRAFPACPLSMKELGAATRSVYLVPCGHVFADIAIRETVKSGSAEKEKKGKGEGEGGDKNDADEDDTHLCPECSEPFRERDIIPILPTESSDIDRLSRRADELRGLGLTHTLKKDKSGGSSSSSKKKRKADTAAAVAEKQPKQNGGDGGDRTGISSRINNSLTASLTAKVLAEQEERNKRRKMVDGHKRSEAVR